MSNFPNHVTLVEVGPRDGLQNEKNIIPTAIKIDLINRLSQTGLKIIEATSFVSPKWIPQLADGAAVLAGISLQTDIRYPVLIPNLNGLNRALQAGAKEIAVICATTETFSQKNTHCSIADSLKRIQETLVTAKQHQLRVRGYISCALGCPFEGTVPPKKVLELATQLITLGCHEICLGDTIGIGTPLQATQLIQTLVPEIPIQRLAIHFHDTYGQALANIYACLALGISTIDSSIAGLGGCPYAKGATGNVATEDVLYLMNGLGITTGIDLDALISVSQFVAQFTGQPPRSKVTLAKTRI